MVKKILFLILSIASSLALASSSHSYGANFPSTTKDQSKPVVNEATLKNISHTLCAAGFTAYVGANQKNVCRNKVTAPNIAYSCVWEKEGKRTHSLANQDPCLLEYTEHRGSITITKDQFSSNPPLSHGMEAQCCARSQVGSSTTRYEY